MSLVMAIANKNGIVVSGDWRLTIKRTNRETNECISVKYDDSAQKIFMAENGHVFGLAGQVGTPGWKYTDDLLYELVKDIHEEHLTLEQELIYIRDELKYRVALPIHLLAAGIEDGKNLIYRTSTDVNEAEIVSKTDGTYGGDAIGVYTVALNIMKESGQHTYDMSLSDLIDFMKEINVATSRALTDIKSVSEKCDFIVISPECGARWFVEDEQRRYKIK